LEYVAKTYFFQNPSRNYSAGIQKGTRTGIQKPGTRTGIHKGTRTEILKQGYRTEI